MKNALKFFAFIVLLASVIQLSACGKISEPTPIEGSGYPHNYPKR